MIYPKKPLSAVVSTIVSTLAMTAATAPVLAEEGFELEEIVVTATRRAQSIQDIPYNISAVSSDTIANAGAGDLADLMKIVPGVVYADMGGRGNAQNSSIVLRGLNVAQQANGSAFANLAVPTVSTYMDDTPVFINLKLTDVERVEVLRGPQGTLYGSGSLAGTVRFIHNRPDTEAMSGSISAGMELLGDSDDETYSVDGMINLPLADNLALRVAATFEDSGGVVDATGVYQRDASGSPVLADPSDVVNSPGLTKTVKDHDTSEVFGIRTSLLWAASDELEVLLAYHHQNLKADGNGFRDSFQDDYVTNTGSVDQFDQDVDIYSIEVEADLGFATLTSSTSYTDMEIEQQRDLSFLVDALDEAVGPCWIYGCYPRGLFIGDEPADRQDFTQEFRLVSNTDGDIDWMVGAYYNDQKASLEIDQTVYGYADWANTPGSDAAVGDTVGFPGGLGLSFYDFWLAGLVANPASVDNQFYNDRGVAFEDKAIYGEVTYHVTDTWQVTLGARYFEQEYESELFQIFSNCGVFCAQDPADPVAGPLGIAQAKASESVEDQVFKLNTSYEINEDTTAYFTWAEGFRHGGANALPVGAFGITADAIPYEADESTNWEMGIKGYLFDNTMDYTLSYFYIDWDKPQIDVPISAAALPAVVNAESAVSQGIELELKGRLSKNLSYSFGYNYTDAELTDDFSVAGVSGVDGESLPGIAKNQANVSLDYLQPLSDGYELHYHLDGQYKDKAENALQSDSSARELEAFSLWSVSASLKAEAWTITAFVNNLFDENDAVYTHSGTAQIEAMARPRSIGVRAGYNF